MLMRLNYNKSLAKNIEFRSQTHAQKINIIELGQVSQVK
jgi:hypothetical protein